MSPWLSDLLLRSQSDERLVILACQGNDRAFVVIVERYRGPLLAFARRFADGERAEDTVQQTLMKAFAAIRAGTEVRHLRGWLHQILRSTAIDEAARASNTSVLRDLPSLDTLEDRVEHTLFLRTTFEHLARLPTRQREALVRTAIDGRSREEIASTMGLSEGSVRQLVHRARASLRNAVTAITPLPLVRWLSLPRSQGPGESVAETAASVGTASGVGAVVKIGTVLATGVAAAGVVASHGGGQHRAGRAGQQIGALAHRVVASTPHAAVVRVSISRAPYGGLGAAGPRNTRYATVAAPRGRRTAVVGRSTERGRSDPRGESSGQQHSVAPPADSSGTDGGPSTAGGTATGSSGGSSGESGSGSGSRNHDGGSGGGSHDGMSGVGGGAGPQPSSSSGSDGSGGGSSGGSDSSDGTSGGSGSTTVIESVPTNTTGSSLVQTSGTDGSSTTGSTGSSSTDGGTGGTSTKDGSSGSSGS